MQIHKYLLSLFLVLCISQSSFAQLNITSAQSSGNWADYYVNNVLLGAGVSALNITFSGDSMQIGEFNQNNSGIIIPDGIILSSGDVGIAIGPNDQGGAGVGTLTNNMDIDLAQLSGVNTFDASVLEFDFVPEGDSVKFNYVFASEEYDEYVCGTVNDAFGFFLSGPGIVGPFTNAAVNLAIIPGTSPPIPVSINTVNNGTVGNNGSLINCTNVSPNWNLNSAYYNSNLNDTTLQYDGHTTVLTARYPVNCGDTYHIKIVICDGGDGAFDSGVFLEGGSFSANPIEVSIATVNGDSTINEGCGTAEIKFTRSSTSDTTYTPITFVGTAINGIDFTLIPDTIIMYPGQTDTTIVIDPFADGLNEGMEFVTITTLTITSCGDTITSSGTLYFFDVPQLNIDLTDTTLTCPETGTISLFANVLSGGPPPYTYNWSTGQSTSIFNHLPIQTNGFDTLIVSVQDSCALYTLTDTLIYRRNVAPYPLVTGLPDTVVNCPGDLVDLSYLAQFGSGQSVVYWHTNDTTSSIEVSVDWNDVFTVTMVDSCARMYVDTVDVTIQPFAPLAAFVVDSTTVYCPGDLVTLLGTASGGVFDYSYSWDESNPVYNDSSYASFTVQNDSFAIFRFRDVCGRTALDSAFLFVQQVEELSIELDNQEVDCDGIEIDFISRTSGGSIPYIYSWSTGDTLEGITVISKEDETYRVKVTDFCGRVAETTASIETPEFPDLTMLIGEPEKVCYGDQFLVEVQASGGAGDYTYEYLLFQSGVEPFDFEKLDSSRFSVVSRSSGVHYIAVSDFCGSVLVDSFPVTVDPCIFVPNVITPNGDGSNEFFTISNIENFENARVSVFNRWGMKVFESSNYKNDWSPTKLAGGTYYYILTSDDFPEQRGDLTIIK